VPVAHGTDHVELVLYEQTDETFLDDRIVVGDEHCGSAHELIRRVQGRQGRTCGETAVRRLHSSSGRRCLYHTRPDEQKTTRTRPCRAGLVHALPGLEEPDMVEQV
jgi:hypothetical protein